MMERTEEEIIIQATIDVVLGGKEYKIAPLVIKDSRGWRKKVIAMIAPLPGVTKVDTDDMESFQAVLTTLLVTMPDQVIELFFEYAKDLKQEEVEAVATDAEIAEAFEAVIKVAFPLAQSAPDILKRLQPEAEPKVKTVKSRKLIPSP